MKKYHGAIVDGEGFTVFEFTTKPCSNYSDAENQAIAIGAAWMAYTGDYEYKWTLEDES